jgi:hypothetical protein
VAEKMPRDLGRTVRPLQSVDPTVWAKVRLKELLYPKGVKKAKNYGFD